MSTNKKTSVIIYERLKALTEISNNMACHYKKIPLPTNDGIWMVKLKDIIRMEAEVNYTKFYFANGETLLIAKTLKEYELLLAENKFERIHKSHLINLYHVNKYYKKSGNYVLMNDNKKIEVSRYKRELLMQSLELL